VRGVDEDRGGVEGWGFVRIDVHGAGAERVDEPRCEAGGFCHCARAAIRRVNAGEEWCF
jgi:hypothetical protein